MIEYKDFQKNKVDELIEKVCKLLANEEQNKICVFQSPTGSGKTVMMARFIELLIKELPETDFCFVWVSIGKGELHIQSKNSLSKIFNGFPDCVLVENEFFGSRSEIRQNEVVVVNWEKLRTKDKTTGDWKNKLMRDGEVFNFIEVLEKTKSKRKIILIIDESHYAADTVRTSELREIVNADVTIEMSATPRLKVDGLDISLGKGDYVYIPSQDVIAAGLIKKELIINLDIDNTATDEKTSQDVILECAYNKRLELKEAFEQQNTSINPLVLIQLPNSDAGDSKKEFVEIFLAEKGITEKNGKLAVWLTGDKSDNLEEISDPENEVEFLIFKQAIDTGWDCPRAHILVKFRDIKSEIFEIQTVGRILRMPEQQHYIDERLNTGYIYTNIQSIEVKKEDYNPNIIKHLKSVRKDIYKDLNLTSYYKSRVDFGDITSSFYKVMEQVFCQDLGLSDDTISFHENILALENRGYKIDIKVYEDGIIKDGSIKVNKFDELGKIKIDETVNIKLADNDILDVFNQVIKNNLSGFAPKRSTPTVREAIYRWFRKFLGIQPHNNGLIIIQSIFLNPNNVEKFSILLSKSIEEYKPVKTEEVKKKIQEDFYEWNIKKEMFFNQFTDEIFESQLCIYDPCYLATDRSRPEKDFEKYIETLNDKILWWYKNGVNKRDYFSVKYMENDFPQSFYPDYIIQFKDGRIGIFDTKKGNTAKEAKSRAEALQQYIKEQNKFGKKLFGGIVIQDPAKKWRLNQKETYNYIDSDLRDWDYLIDII